MKKFKIKSRESEKYFIVLIYDKVKDLVKDADVYDSQAGKTVSNEGVLGIVHPFERYKIVGKKEVKHPEVGIIRLSKKHASTEIVSHEVGHAAIQLYRVITRGHKADFGESNGKKEEKFLHLYGQLFRDMTRKLYRYGVWK